jgi:hypothetical protein
MCDEWGTQCRGEGCYPGPVFLACEPLLHCVNCTVGLMATNETPMQDEAGKWQMPTGAIYGYLVKGAGWVITDGGHSELKPDDLVLTIDGEPANANFFAMHSFEMFQEKKPTEWTARVYRPGERFLLTVVLKPPML